MKNLNEMTGVEVFEALIESGTKGTIENMFSIFGGKDLQILSHKVRSMIMDVLSEKAFFSIL